MRLTRVLFGCALFGLLAAVSSGAAELEMHPLRSPLAVVQTLQGDVEMRSTCKPQGVCDPNDSMSCNGGPGTNGTVPVRVDATGFVHLQEQDPLVGAVLWGATDAGFAPDGTCTGTTLRLGTQKGTMDSEVGGYSWTLTVNDAGGGRLEFRGLLVSATGQEIVFHGNFRDAGRMGRVMVERDHRGGAPRALAWDSPKTSPVQQ